MAIEQSLKSFTRQANVDLTAKQFYFVVGNGGKADLPAADGVRTLGVLQDTPKAGDPAAIAFGGVSKVISDGSIEVDKPVAAKSGGLAKEAATGEYIQGIALEGDGGVAGTVISVLLHPQGRLP